MQVLLLPQDEELPTPPGHLPLLLPQTPGLSSVCPGAFRNSGSAVSEVHSASLSVKAGKAV